MGMMRCGNCNEQYSIKGETKYISAFPETYCIVEWDKPEISHEILHVWGFQIYEMGKCDCDDSDLYTEITPITGNFQQGFEQFDFTIMFVGTKKECMEYLPTIPKKEIKPPTPKDSTKEDSK
jgi:hypothetical protein